ncbi:hypothetical protein MMC17_005947 [Xylographa soralifera]|nr:hypothetical protein [Xylographa soralifera]
MVVPPTTENLLNGDIIHNVASSSNEVLLDPIRDASSTIKNGLEEAEEIIRVDDNEEPGIALCTEPLKIKNKTNCIDLREPAASTTILGNQATNIETPMSPTKRVHQESLGDNSSDSSSSIDSAIIQKRRRSKKLPSTGSRNAKEAGRFFRALQKRLSLLETQILNLQSNAPVNASSLEPSEAVVVIEENPSQDPIRDCISSLPLGITIVDLKHWLLPSGHGSRKRGKTVIDIAVVNYLGDSGFHAQQLVVRDAKVKQPTAVNKSSHHPTGTIATEALPKSDIPQSSKLPVRIGFESPWISMLLYQLAGKSSDTESFGVLMRPFKPIIAYEKQIRKFVELLGKADTTITSNKELVATLNKTLKEAVGPQEAGFDEISDIKTYSLLRDMESLQGHFRTIDDVVSGDPNENDESEEDGQSVNVADPRTTNGGNSKSIDGQDMSKKDKDAQNGEKEVHSGWECTCLKDAKEHFQLLIKLMDEYLIDLINMRGDVVSGKLQKIGFENLWLLYQTGDIVVSSQADHQAYRVLQVSGGRPLMVPYIDGIDEPQGTDRKGFKNSPLTINLVKLDFDGINLGPVQEQREIREFEEEIPITKLEVYPINLAKNSTRLRSDLVERGRKFVRLAKIEHMQYSGLNVGEPQEEVDSEIITDFALAFMQPENSDWKPKIGISGPTFADKRELFEDDCHIYDCSRWSHNDIYNDVLFDKKRMEDFVSAAAYDLLKHDTLSHQNFSEDQLMLLSSRTFAFALRNRKWVQLNIDQVKEVEQLGKDTSQKTGFEDLVIPEEYKRVVKALVLNHSAPKRSRRLAKLQPEAQSPETNYEVDLIKGKGKGLIILLHGVPGVGKTSTAESVAAYTGKPLFPITCGDIGQTADRVEKKLESLFLLARKWDCVLLLDEADVFLAKRERGDIKRNALVSVFLRVLEYYSGILFLTTNRVGEFDEAFKSRIHISLYYPDLDEESTMKVWDMNLVRLARSAREIGFSKDRILEYAKNHWDDGGRWNGRQIRNAFQTAIALAEFDHDEECRKCQEEGSKPPIKPSLTMKHFESVATTSEKFDQYLISVMGGDSFGKKAKTSEIRNDNWTHQPTTGATSSSSPKTPRVTRLRNQPTTSPLALKSAGTDPRLRAKLAREAKERREREEAERLAEEEQLRLEEEAAGYSEGEYEDGYLEGGELEEDDDLKT